MISGRKGTHINNSCQSYKHMILVDLGFQRDGCAFAGFGLDVQFAFCLEGAAFHVCHAVARGWRIDVKPAAVVLYCDF